MLDICHLFPAHRKLWYQTRTDCTEFYIIKGLYIFINLVTEHLRAKQIKYYCLER